MKSLNGWQRIGIVVSVLWVLSILYISFSLYDSKPDMNLLAVAALDLAPIAILWGAGYAIAWIRRGFGQTNA